MEDGPFSLLYSRRSDCGELDQCTERSLICFYRWV